MGNKVKLSSGALSLTLDKPANQISQSSSLNNIQAGNSYCNFGEVRRFVLPTDTEKSNIFSLRPTAGIIPFDVGKEFNVSVRWPGSIPSPAGTEIASFSVGDVIDDSIPAPILMVSTGGGNVKWYRNVQDKSGFMSAFSEKIDDLGNYEVTALTGTLVNWTTAAASWNITNMSTVFTSSTSFSVTSTTIDFNGMVNLGASAATDYVVKGTTFIGNLSSFLTSMNSTLATLLTALASAGSIAVDPGAAALVTCLTAATTAMQVSVNSLSGTLQGALSTTVKTV